MSGPRNVDRNSLSHIVKGSYADGYITSASTHLARSIINTSTQAGLPLLVDGDHPCETNTDQWLTSLSPTEQLGNQQKRQSLAASEF